MPQSTHWPRTGSRSSHQGWLPSAGVSWGCPRYGSQRRRMLLPSLLPVPPLRAPLSPSNTQPRCSRSQRPSLMSQGSGCQSPWHPQSKNQRLSQLCRTWSWQQRTHWLLCSCRRGWGKTHRRSAPWLSLKTQLWQKHPPPTNCTQGRPWCQSTPWSYRVFELSQMLGRGKRMVCPPLWA